MGWMDTQKVWVDETRPRLQGSRLTAWELQEAGVPMHLIADNAAGLLMYQGKVDVVLFGADRVTRNGDVANKIGSYKLAICAREHGIPVYACVPVPTIDLELETGRDILIEERDGDEVRCLGLKDGAGGTEEGEGEGEEEKNTPNYTAPPDVPVFNPAFDITPAKYLTGIITDQGICYPPFSQSLAEAVARYQAASEKAAADMGLGHE